MIVYTESKKPQHPQDAEKKFLEGVWGNTFYKKVSPRPAINGKGKVEGVNKLPQGKGMVNHAKKHRKNLCLEVANTCEASCCWRNPDNKLSGPPCLFLV